jgi:ribonuclease PH
VMTASGRFVEVQGTAEGATFDRAGLDAMLELAGAGITDITRRQAELLADPPPAR